MHIRIATVRDADAVAAIYAPIVRDTVITFETVVPTPADMAARIGNTLKTFPWLVAEDASGNVIGYAYASQHRKREAYSTSCEVSVYVDGAARGQGIGRKLYEALLPVLIRQNYILALAGITLPNAASIGLHEALGFKYLGTYRNVGYKLGAWLEVGWWERLLAAPEVPPRPLIPFRDLEEALS